MLISKFGEKFYRDVNMAWFWARLHKRTPRLGYFVGGFQGFADLLSEKVQTQGGKVLLNTPVHSISSADGSVRIETQAGGTTHQRVIATCSPHALRRLAPEITGEYASQLDSLSSMGAVVLILALRHRLTSQHYWINVPAGQGMPFMGLVEHTNYIPRKHYGGDHLVYCGDYLPPDHPYFEYEKEELLKAYEPGIVKINPEFKPDWVRASWMFTEKYAQPVPTLSHSQNIPPLRTPIPGLWLANMSQVYPWDRGSNYSVEMGRRVALEVVG
jgi:protoporphyrinogen oxidase